MRAFRHVVIGAGPAGLSAAAELSRVGSCLLLDAGREANVRDRYDATDLLAGIGGAGLFSDGKHSFYPAATALWQLPDRDALASAFAATAQLLASVDVAAGVLPSRAHEAAPTCDENGWQPKPYPSLYVPLPARLALIEQLRREANFCATQHEVVAARREGAKIILDVMHAGRVESIVADHVVLAGGRWAPRHNRVWLEALGVRHRFVRAEFGMRLELPATHALFAMLPGVDGKLRWVDRQRALELRTFCTCRRGEVLLGEQANLRAWSGRADGPPTERSNVGLLVRTTDATLGHEVLAAIARATPLEMPLADFHAHGVAALTPLFGACGALIVHEAFERLVAFCPSLANADGRVVAPALEGIGDYAIDDGHGNIADNVWIAGDATGHFRGIVAAMVSGRYVARRMLAS